MPPTYTTREALLDALATILLVTSFAALYIVAVQFE